ncbi:MAG TPA: hypothetical protein VGJ05_00120, partial [Fimbriiglobus sp.]
MPATSLHRFLRRWTKGTKTTPARTRQRSIPQLVRIEDRIVPTGIVPTPQASGGAEIPGLTRINGGTPINFLEGAAAANPLAPSQIVQVGVGVAGANSSLTVAFPDGSSFNLAQIADPAVSTTTVTKFTQAFQPSIAYGRDGMVHIVYVQGNADKSSGILVYDNFQWKAGAATPIASSVSTQILRQWTGSNDPAFNPVVAVDNNVAVYTDPVTGITSRDPLADPSHVYVFWNTKAAPTTQLAPAQVFNPSVIEFLQSSDDGKNFGAARMVSDPTNGFVVTSVAANKANYGSAEPVVAFSPGNSATPGKITIAWGSTNNGAIFLDSSTPGNLPGTTVTFSDNT